MWSAGDEYGLQRCGSSGLRMPCACRSPKPSRHHASTSPASPPHQHVVGPPPLFHPLGGGRGVQLAHHLRGDVVGDRVPGRVDPRVPSPHRTRLRLADEVADEPAGALGGDRTHGAGGPQLLEVGARHSRVPEDVADQRLAGDLPAVAGSQQLGRTVEIRAGESAKADVTHARTVGLAADRRQPFSSRAGDDPLPEQPRRATGPAVRWTGSRQEQSAPERGWWPSASVRGKRPVVVVPLSHEPPAPYRSSASDGTERP